jgi:hypothetical protein
MPAAPTPDIALPTMKAVELGAAPHKAEAASNSRTLERKTVFRGYSVYSVPKSSWNAQQVSRYALPYQPTSVREWNCSVI